MSAPSSSMPTVTIPRWDRHDLAAALGLALLLMGYFVACGDRVSYIWGDYGRWHEEVRRFVQGEVPYRDFTWQYPPLAIYVYGAWGMCFGVTLASMHILSFLVTGMILALVFLIARLCVPRALLPWTVLAVSLLGIAGSNVNSQTLALGMYTPAMPLGILAILLALYGGLRSLLTPAALWAWCLGLGSAGAFLAKQDFWPCAVVLLVGVVFSQWRASATTGGFLRLALCWSVPCAGLTILGYTWVAVAAGPVALLDGLQGFGLGGSSLGRALPTWRRIVDQLCFFSAGATLFCAVLLVSHPRRRRPLFRGLLVAAVTCAILVALRISMTEHVAEQVVAGDLRALHTRTGSELAYLREVRDVSSLDLWRASAVHLRNEGFRHVLPLALALCLGAAVVWKFRGAWPGHGPESALLLLALFILAARLRRGFEHTDVLHLLMEPLFLLLAVQLWWLAGRRTLGLLVGVFLALGTGLVLYHTLQRWGLPYQEINTVQGRLSIPAAQAEEFERVRAVLHAADPDAKQPLLCLPYGGVLNYLLGRRNPTVVTQGLYGGMNVDRERLIASIRRERPIIVLDVSLLGDVPPLAEPGLSLTSWEPVRRPWNDDAFYRSLPPPDYTLQIVPGVSGAPRFEVHIPGNAPPERSWPEGPSWTRTP